MLNIPRPRIYLGSPLDKHLDPAQLTIKREIISALEKEGLEPQEFLTRGLVKRSSWSFDGVAQIMPRCQGAIILALARWRWPIKDDVALMPSEYSHFEGALALSHSLPTWIVAEEGVLNRGIVWTGGGHAITYVSLTSGPACMADPEMANSFQTWVEEVKSRPRVFLGYCGQARATANDLQLFMERTLNVTVRNYAMDFSAGGTILDEIERAGRDCTCGIFLFTKDDPLISTDSGSAAPRDNVVFEAGYFIRAKGKERTLIIREEGAKMPADLGGNIYISLKDRNDISAIHTSLNRFLAERL